MKKKHLLITFALIFSLISFPNNLAAAPGINKILFWDKIQKGANIFNQEVTIENIKAAKAYGIRFIRLSPDKFISSKRDFLIGNADDYKNLVPEDLAILKKVLDICAGEEMPVVLTMLSLPGSRWSQNNNNKDDLRIWTEVKFQQQAVKFWQDLATELKNHPAIVGYNLLNEPHPERIYDSSSVHIHEIKQQEVQQILFSFYQDIISSVRIVDPTTPIILDSSAYGDPNTFRYLKPQLGENIIYSFHMYEPYNYTNAKINQGKLVYPGKIDGKYWDKNALKNYIEDVIKFQKANKVPSNRILVGEFGGYRASKGLPQYFQDLIDIFQENSWHFAFYAFREDTWDGMDYELGDKKLPWSYWEDIEQGKKPILPRHADHAQFKVLREAMKAN